jgi:hypothetical protein
MALFDDFLGGGNWVTGLAIGVGAVIVLPLAAPILRPLAKTAIKGGILAYRVSPKARCCALPHQTSNSTVERMNAVQKRCRP